MMRLVNTHSAAMKPARDMGSPAVQIENDDPRWVFAMRVRAAIEYQVVDEQAIARLLDQASAIGLNPMQARAIMGIIQDATQRGGIDTRAHREIASVPVNEAARAADDLSDRARWIAFGMLFVWALLIAGLMQLV